MEIITINGIEYAPVTRTTDAAPMTTGKPQRPSAQADAVEALRELVDALDGAFISSWQSTAAWQTQLDRARAALATRGGGNAE